MNNDGLLILLQINKRIVPLNSLLFFVCFVLGTLPCRFKL